MEHSIEDIIRLIDDKNFSKAEELARILVQSNPDDFDALLLLGRVLGLEGSFDNAKEIFEKAYTLNPDHDKLVYYLGITHENLEEYDEAVEYYKKILGSG